MLAEVPGGMFLTRTAIVTSEGLELPRLHRFMDNREQCVFPVTKPYPVDTFEELKATPLIPSEPNPERWMFIGEDNGFFPFSCNAVSDWSDIERRQHRRLEYQEVGRQNAELFNIRKTLGNPLTTTFAVMAAIIVAVMAAIIAVAFIGFQLNNTPPPTAVVALFLMGAIAAPTRRIRILSFPKRKPKLIGPPIPKKPVDPQWSVYIYNTTNGRKLHYSLPFSEIAANIDPAAWRFPNLQRYKPLGAIAGSLSTMMVLMLPAMIDLTLIILSILIGAVFVPVAAVAGWFFGPKLAKTAWNNKPYVKLYLGIVVHQEESEATDEDEDEETMQAERWTETVLLPMRYTGLTGVDPVLWDEIIAENIEEVQQAAQEAGLKQVPQFDPVVNRADDAWEDVHGLLEREDTKIPMSRSEQIKLISLVVIAGSMIAITFFIVMATAG